MGFFGSFIAADTDRPLAEVEWMRESGTNELWRAADGRWHLLQVDDFVAPTQAVATELGVPILAAYVVDSDFAVLTARLPDGRGWRWTLSPKLARSYGAPEEDIGDLDESTDEVMAWAGAAGLFADREAVKEQLTRESDPFAEDVVFGFFSALGLRFVERE